MKKIMLLMLCLLTSVAVSAQNYETLWKSVKEHQYNDLPKSALEVLVKIRNKAISEGNDAQLLKAALVMRQMHEDISTDSGKVALARMEEALARETRPVQRALWQSALGQQYATMNSYWTPDTAAERRADELLRASISDIELLAATKASDYMPLFEEGEDSKIYGNNLLSVLYPAAVSDISHMGYKEKRDNYGRMAAYYRSHKMTEATLLVELDSMKNEPYDTVRYADRRDVKKYMQMTKTYEKSPLLPRIYARLLDIGYTRNGEDIDSIHLEIARLGLEKCGKMEGSKFLKNFIERKEAPLIILSPRHDLTYPGKPLKFRITSRNGEDVSVDVFRLPYTAATLPNIGYQSESVYMEKAVHVKTFKKQLKPCKAWRTQADSMDISFDRPGLYMVKVSNGKISSEPELVYVTRVRPLVLNMGERFGRVTAVDAITGKPLLGSRLVSLQYDSKDENLNPIDSVSCDKEGNIILPDYMLTGNSEKYALKVGSDQYCPIFDIRGYRYYGNNNRDNNAMVRLYTDRAIYRPGQEVHLGFVAYRQMEDSLWTVEKPDWRVAMFDANGKRLEEQKVTTDDYGNGSCDFKLPDSCMPGRFRIQVSASGANTEHTYFRVEEYKRPTFTASLTLPETEYKIGDSITVTGLAETYTGIPVRNATVRYKIVRPASYGSSEDTQSGETTTDDEGRFLVPMKLTKPSVESHFCWWRSYYTFRVTADVSAESGETTEALTVVYASMYSSWLNVAWANIQCKETPSPITITRQNMPGRNIPGRGYYEIHREGQVMAADSFSTGQAFTPAAFASLPSGLYGVKIRVADLPEDTLSFTLMSEKDRRPFVKDKICFYKRMSAKRDSAFVMIGSPELGVTLFYDVISCGKVIKSTRHSINNNLLHFNLSYKPEYGDGVRHVFSFVRDGKCYTREIVLRKPEPDKRLKLKWSSFRSMLKPGQQEEWRLSVLKPDGTPAEASVIACMYDASLDQLATNPWTFSLSFPRSITRADVSSVNIPLIDLRAEKYVSYYSLPSIKLTKWDSELFGRAASHHMVLYERQALGAAPGKARRLNKVAVDDYAEEESADADDAMDEKAVIGYGDKQEEGTSDEGGSKVQPRTNFNETAFFMPALRTDSTGQVQIAFTLPESLTAWNFRALAHDRSVDYGQIEETIIARKEFMVQTSLPRFIREGDKATLPATLFNLTEKPIQGTAHLLLTDAESGRTVFRQSMPFNVEKQQVVNFEFSPDASVSVLVCRITAEGGDFSDGEEKYLPVLPDREIVLRTVPFSFTKAGIEELKIDTLWSKSPSMANRRLVVEASSNPTWYAVTALPAITEAECMSSVSWATRYYALSMAQYVAAQHPEIRAAASSSDGVGAWANLLNRNADLKQVLVNETPWATDADDEASRTAALASLFNPERSAQRRVGALDKLKELQLGTGGWSWYKGMFTSDYITSEIAVLLARQQQLTGSKESEPVLKRAMQYLEGRIAEQVKEMKRLEKKYKITFEGSEFQLKYLYLRALMEKKLDGDAKYLLEKFNKVKKTDMYTKAIKAVVLAHYGRKDVARKDIESLVQHTVSHKEMGRYFDSDRTLWCWNSYRIPTQVATIEALQLVAPERHETVEEMRLWLMQARRTQAWNTNRATTDALYALLVSSKDSAYVKNLSQNEPLYYSVRQGEDILAVNGKSQAQDAETVGYFRQDYTDERTLQADNVQIRKRDDGLSWGAVYAQYTLPTSDVVTSGNGLTVSRSLEVQRSGKWQPVEANTILHKGERVRQIFTITADRDYDFVALKASRAACLEPVERLSGYSYRDGVACYRVVRDASNEYFFEKMRKGSRVFTDESFVDRTGRYSLGSAKIQSQYAPEFCGTAAGQTITVE